MQCPSCGQTGSVTIAGKRFCTSCGATLSNDVATPTPATSPGDRPAAAVKPPLATVAATAFHSNQADVLDLRQAKPIAVAKPPTVVTVAAEPPQPASAAAVPPPNPSVTSPATEPTSTIKAAVITRNQNLQTNAQTITQSAAISKFHPPSLTPVATEPATATVPPLPTHQPIALAAPATPVEPAVPAQPSPPPVTAPIAPVTPIAPAAPNIASAHQTPLPTATGPTTTMERPPVRPAPLPNAAAAQIHANRQLIPRPALAQIDPEEARRQAYHRAMDKPKRRASPVAVAAALAAVIVLGGYIWLQNYPKLAIKTAGDKAGFTATLPTYVPTSYSLNRSVSSQPGQVTLTFAGVGNSNDLIIKQRPTDWDSRSLLDNYVASASSQYLAVEQQGLTIYLYNGSDATWVNQGIWYSIEGNNHLNQEQILKIIHGL